MVNPEPPSKAPAERQAQLTPVEGDIDGRAALLVMILGVALVAFVAYQLLSKSSSPHPIDPARVNKGTGVQLGDALTMTAHMFRTSLYPGNILNS